MGKNKENVRTSAKENLGLYVLKQHKLCFDKECLCRLDQRKDAKKQWLQDPNQRNVDNLQCNTRSYLIFQEQKEGISES